MSEHSKEGSIPPPAAFLRLTSVAFLLMCFGVGLAIPPILLVAFGTVYVFGKEGVYGRLVLSLTSGLGLVSAIAVGVLLGQRISRTARRLMPLRTGLVGTLGVLSGDWIASALSPAEPPAHLLISQSAGLLLGAVIVTWWAPRD